MKYFWKTAIVFSIASLILFLTGCSGNNSSIQALNNGIISGSVTIDTVNIPQQKSANQNIARFYTTTRDLTYTPEHYILKHNSNTDIKTVIDQIKQRQVEILAKLAPHTYKIEITDCTPELINSLKKKKIISYIEPDYPVHLQQIPDDPEFSKQWNLKLLGMEEVWDTYQGSNDIVVAVLDTGILPEHPDLRDNLVNGYDFIDNDNYPLDTSIDFSHGTHVAGIIGAVANNRKGIAGINWQVKIMPVRVVGPNGSGGYSNLISGINWATDNGADIINLSLAGSFYSEALENAIDYALERGVTVIAASGNDGSPSILYPAKYQNVISVGSIGPDKTVADYSNYGNDLDLVAPGGNSMLLNHNYNTILSTAGYLNNNGQAVYEYSWAQGTSMATPHVSGIAALLYSRGITDPIQIRQILKETAIDLGPKGDDSKYGAGLVNARGALNLNTDIAKNNDNKMRDSGGNRIQDIVLFTAHRTEDLEQSSTMVHPDVMGNYRLESPPGSWKLLAWLDVNGNQDIDNGDYLATKDVEVVNGEVVKGIKLVLKEIR